MKPVVIEFVELKTLRYEQATIAVNGKQTERGIDMEHLIRNNRLEVGLLRVLTIEAYLNYANQWQSQNLRKVSFKGDLSLEYTS